MRRSRRLVVSAIHTLGNYEYGVFWYFYLDGTIQMEVKLTGIVGVSAVADGAGSDTAPLIAPSLASPIHQHLFCFRLDFDLEGERNSVYEVRRRAAAGSRGPSREWVPVGRYPAAQREGGPARSRPLAKPPLAGDQPPGAEPSRGARRLQAAAAWHADAPRRGGLRARPSGALAYAAVAAHGGSYLGVGVRSLQGSPPDLPPKAPL